MYSQIEMDECSRLLYKLFKKIKTFFMKKLLLVLCFLFACSIAYAKEPKFKVHVIHDSKMEGFNYSINYPVVIDYDNDGDQDILVLAKDGTLYFLENLEINKEDIK